MLLLQPLIPERLIRRPEYDALLLLLRQFLSSCGESGERRLRQAVISNNGLAGSTGKSVLLNLVLRRLKQEMNECVSDVLWLSLEQWRQESSCPARSQHELLIRIAYELSIVLSPAAADAADCHIGLLPSTIDELQDYIRRQSMALSFDSTNAKVVLVLDGVIHPSEIAAFGYLGMPTIITTRNPEVVSSDIRFSVSGLSSPQQLRSLLIDTTGSLDISGPALRLMACTTSCIMGSVYLPHIIKDGLVGGESSLHSLETVGIVDCIQVIFHKLPESERHCLLLLGTLPTGLVVTWDLSASLWGKSVSEAMKMAAVFRKQGLITISSLHQQDKFDLDDDSSCFSVHFEVADCLRKLLFSDADGSSMLQAESVRRMINYLTDYRIFARKFYDALQRRTIIVCWEHILRLGALPRHLFDSPMSAYDSMLSNCDIPKNQQIINLIRGRVAVVVNSLESFQFALQKDENFNWREASRWSASLLARIERESESVIRTSFDFNTALQTCINASRVMVGNKLFAEAAKFVAKITTLLFSLAEEALDSKADSLVHLKSNITYLIGKCHLHSRNYEGALESLSSSLKFLGTSLQDATLARWQNPDCGCRIAYIISALSFLNRPQEVNSLLRSKLAKIEERLADSSLCAAERLGLQELLIVVYLQLGSDLAKQPTYLLKAKKVIEKSLALALKVYGELHPIVASNISVLLSVCVAAKKYDKALPLSKRLVALSQSVYGMEHPRSITAVTGMVAVMKLVGIGAETVTKYVKRNLVNAIRVSALRKETGHADFDGQLPRNGFESLGDEGFLHVQLLQLLADVSLTMQGDVTTAKAYTKRAIQTITGQKDRLVFPSCQEPAQHIKLGNLLGSMGSFCLMTGKVPKAIKLLQHALDRYCLGATRVLDVGSITACLLSLKDGFLKLGLLEEAESVCQGAILMLTHVNQYMDESRSSALIDGKAFLSVALAESLKSVANVLMVQGRHDESAEFLLRVLVAASDPSIPPPFDEEQFWIQRGNLLDQHTEVYRKACSEEALPDTANHISCNPIKFWPAALDSAVQCKFDAQDDDLSESFLQGLTEDCDALETPLHVAVREGHEDVVSMLIEGSVFLTDESSKVDVNAVDGAGFTPLHLACLHGFVGLAEYLLDHGAEIDQTNHHGDTSLILASLKGCRSVASMLIERGATRALENADGMSASDVAAAQKDHGMLHLLTNDEYQAVAIQSAWRMSKARKVFVAYRMATRIQSMWRMRQVCVNFARCQSHLLKLSSLNDLAGIELALAQGCSLNMRDPQDNGSTPLIQACLLGAKEVVSLLLRKGADPKKGDYDGTIPLAVCCLSGNAEIAAILITHTNNSSEAANQRDCDGTAPLHVAVREGHKDVVTMLIESSKVDVNAVDGAGFTPLHLACLHGFVGLAEYLLDHGAEIDQTNHHGDTSLILASLKGCRSVASMLIERGATRALENADGMSASDVAAAQKDHGMLHLLTNDEYQAVAIQSAWRMSKARKVFVAYRMATRIQSMWRMRQVRVVYMPILRFRLFNSRSEGRVIWVQTKFRSFLAKRRFLQMRLADISKRVDKIILEKKVDAAKTIQRALRRFCYRRFKTPERLEAFLLLRRQFLSACAIQRQWRLHQQGRSRAAQTLQRFWTAKRSRADYFWRKLMRRNLKAMNLDRTKRDNSRLVKENGAASAIQRCWKSFLFQPPRAFRRNGAPSPLQQSKQKSDIDNFRRVGQLDSSNAFFKAAILLSGSKVLPRSGPGRATFQNFLESAAAAAATPRPWQSSPLAGVSDSKWAYAADEGSSSSDEEVGSRLL